MKPLVGIIMGSTSDWDTLRGAADTLDALAVPYEVKVVSAHRTPDLLFEYASTARARGLEVIIAGAGGAAHLPGMTASKTTLPVLGVPVQSKALNGLDSLLSIVQMPAGIPVATFAIGAGGRGQRGARRRRDPGQQTPRDRHRARALPRAADCQGSQEPRSPRDRRAAHDHRHRGRRPARPHARIGRLSARPRLPVPRSRRRRPGRTGRAADSRRVHRPAPAGATRARQRGAHLRLGERLGRCAAQVCRAARASARPLPRSPLRRIASARNSCSSA